MATNVSTTGGWSERPVYNRTTIIGLLVYAAVLLIFVGVIMINGELADATFAFIFLVPTAIIVGLMLRFGTWAAIVGAVWALLNLVANGPFLLPSLAHVNSFFDFGLGLAIVVGLAVATVTGIIAVVQSRRGTARTTTTGGERGVFIAIAVVVVGLMALSGILQNTSATTVSAEDKVGATEISMKNVKFNPVEIRATAGASSKVAIKNSDLFVHTFTIEGRGVDVTIIGGSEKLVEILSLPAGTYEYICTIAGHEDMTGTLVVE